MRAALVFGLLLTTISPAFANMGLGFGWGPTTQCFDPNSPPITVTDVPEGTTTLRFKLTDLDATNFNHGGGDVAFNGQETLPYGAFTYKGPCPPDPSRPHHYQLSLQALDANGALLSSAKAERSFP